MYTSDKCASRLAGGGAAARASRRALIVLALLLVVGLAPASFAQTTGSATLRGTVKDANGAVVPNAAVVLVSDRTGQERRITTGGEGTYTFASVDPGTYTLKVEAANFKAYQQRASW